MPLSILRNALADAVLSVISGRRIVFEVNLYLCIR